MAQAESGVDRQCGTRARCWKDSIWYSPHKACLPPSFWFSTATAVGQDTFRLPMNRQQT
jgi:hypothetical protein